VREREIEWTELMWSANAGDGAAYHRLLTGIALVLRATVEGGFERAGRPKDQCEMIVQENFACCASEASHLGCEYTLLFPGCSRLPATNCWT
jgi:hypothetical protein